MFSAELYARISTNDQQALATQNGTMLQYATQRGWIIALQVREKNYSAVRRAAREKLIEAAPRRVRCAAPEAVNCSE
jgi:DNA invertase Pin-like site-specific DNA recombinase